MRSRSETGERINRMDAETADFYSNVRAAYLALAEKEPKRFCVIDANRSVEEIQSKVIETATKFLENNKAPKD